MPSRRSIALAGAVVLLASIVYAIARHRVYFQDVDVYRTAAARALAAEPLYRADDGFFQFKYWPAFAFAMAPLAALPADAAHAVWLAVTVGLFAAGLRLALLGLPDRRRSPGVLAGWTVLLAGKFLVRELVTGQVNVLLGVLVLGGGAALARRRAAAAGLLMGTAAFVKPYALVFLPWLALTRRMPAAAAAGGAIAAGLALPALVYGWAGNAGLLAAWYDTVRSTTAVETLSIRENISFASAWTKWLGPGGAASIATVASLAAAAGLVLAVWWRGRRAGEASGYLEIALLLLLVPLISPQGWDYVLVAAVPAFLCLVDRWREIAIGWRIAAGTGFALTSFALYDLYGRAIYIALGSVAAFTVGAVLIVAALAHLRWRDLA